MAMPGYRVDVGGIGVEIDDARAQRVAAVDDGVRDEGFPAALNRVEHRRVQRVEIASTVAGSPIARPQVGGHVAERRDAQILRQQLELAGARGPRLPCARDSRMSSPIICR